MLNAYLPFLCSVLALKGFLYVSSYCLHDLYLQTSSFFLHIFKIQFTEKRIQIGGKQPSGLFLASISLLLSEQVPFAQKDLTV